VFKAVVSDLVRLSEGSTNLAIRRSHCVWCREPRKRLSKLSKSNQ